MKNQKDRVREKNVAHVCLLDYNKKKFKKRTEAKLNLIYLFVCLLRSGCSAQQETKELLKCKKISKIIIFGICFMSCFCDFSCFVNDRQSSSAQQC